MEEPLDHGLAMEETDPGLLRRPSLRETYHRDSLLAPDADFITGRREPATTLEVAGAFGPSGFRFYFNTAEIISRSGQRLFIQAATPASAA